MKAAARRRDLIRVALLALTALASTMVSCGGDECGATSQAAASTPDGLPPAALAAPGVTPVSASRSAYVVANGPYPAGSVGYAISWPQCGGPYPEEPFAFGIVGVTDGRAFTRNPCFADEYRWARRGQRRPSIYMNVNYLDSTDDFEGWWACDDAPCRAYRYGWVAAHDAYTYASSFNAVAPVWWLDVQIVSDWSVDLTLNADAIRGAAEYLKSKGIRVGISSTSFQWTTVVGDARHNMPVWDASATDADEAAAFCMEGKDFGGGHTEQIAYVADGFEVVLACGEAIPISPVLGASPP